VLIPRLSLAAVVAACLALTACGSDDSSAKSDGDSAFSGKTVCIDQYATATVIDDLLSGIKSGLSDATDQGLEIKVENPNADSATEKTIAQKFITSDCDVVVPVGTAAAQLMATVIRDIPIVFAASSTPVEAKLVASMDEPGGNVTGVADVVDPAPEIDAMAELIPGLHTVGLIWKNGDPAGDALADKAKAHLDELGIDYITATVTNGSEVTQAAESLVGRVQAIGLPGDTTTISAAGGILKVANSAKLPVFGGTTSAVELGSVVSASYDYKVVGGDVADLVLKVLDGADPATTPVVIPDTGGLDLNVTQLKKLGIEVPDSVRDAALNTY